MLIFDVSYVMYLPGIHDVYRESQRAHLRSHLGSIRLGSRLESRHGPVGISWHSHDRSRRVEQFTAINRSTFTVVSGCCGGRETDYTEIRKTLASPQLGFNSFNSENRFNSFNSENIQVDKLF